MSFAVSPSPRLFSSRYARRQSMSLFTLTPLTGGLPILSRRRILATQIALTALARSFGACVASTTSATAKRPQKGILAEMRAGVRGFAAKLAGGVDPQRHVRPLGRRANGYSDQPLVTAGAATGYLPTGLLPTGYLPTGAGAAGTG